MVTSYYQLSFTMVSMPHGLKVLITLEHNKLPQHVLQKQECVSIVTTICLCYAMMQVELMLYAFESMCCYN